ncbi:MAG: O-antigen ligase family protein [Candidatus Pacebacteria bacterium]|nr:O-antigen ligase family protein [Candidatus Paceibacterota bacterium]
MSIILKTIFISELVLAFAMVLGIVPQEFSYLILILLSVSFVKMSMLDSLKLFILSIPFFVALPPNAISDSMSIWRVLIVILFCKFIWEKHKNCHSELISESVSDKNLIHFKLLRQNIKEIINIGDYKKKILKQVRGDKTKYQSFGIIKSVIKNKLFLYTVIFFTIAIISLLYAPSFGMGVKKILFLGNIILLFPVIRFAIKEEENFVQILQYIFYTSFIVVLIGYFQFISTFFVPLYTFWQFWAGNVIQALYGQNLSDLLSFSNTWFSYYRNLPPTLRMFSVMPDSHSFALFVVVSIPVLLALLFFYKNGRKRFLSLVLIFFFMAISFSGSRGAWVGSIFALFSAVLLAHPSILSSLHFQNRNLKKFRLKYLKNKLINNESYFLKILRNIKHKKNSNNFIITPVLLFLFLMPISFLFLSKNQQAQSYMSGQGISIEKSDIFERAKSISDFSEISNKGRFQIWNETLVFVRKHPFSGAGFGNFPSVLGENFANAKRGSSAHNIYLDILAELGIFGLVIFLLIIFEILKKAYSLYFRIEKKYLKIFVGSFFVYFSWMFGYGLFDVVLFNDKVLIFVVIMTSLLYCIENEKKWNL